MSSLILLTFFRLNHVPGAAARIRIAFVEGRQSVYACRWSERRPSLIKCATMAYRLVAELANRPPAARAARHDYKRIEPRPPGVVFHHGCDAEGKHGSVGCRHSALHREGKDQDQPRADTRTGGKLLGGFPPGQ